MGECPERTIVPPLALQCCWYISPGSICIVVTLTPLRLVWLAPPLLLHERRSNSSPSQNTMSCRRYYTTVSSYSWPDTVPRNTPDGGRATVWLPWLAVMTGVGGRHGFGRKNRREALKQRCRPSSIAQGHRQ